MPATMKVKKDSSTWVTTSYTYDDAGNLLTTTDPSGKVLTNTYGTLNGENGYLLSATDRFGKKTVYTYDEKGRVTQINEEKPDGTQIRRAAKYTYDSYGNVPPQLCASTIITLYLSWPWTLPTSLIARYCSLCKNSPGVLANGSIYRGCIL